MRFDERGDFKYMVHLPDFQLKLHMLFAIPRNYMHKLKYPKTSIQI
jgi:hypothetical protein